MIEVAAFVFLAALGQSDLPTSIDWDSEVRRIDVAPDPGWLPASVQEPAPGSGDKFSLHGAVHGRYSIPFGAADRHSFVYGNGLVVVDHSLSWLDLFDPGWGFDIEVDLLFGPKNRNPGGDPGFQSGVVVLLTTDEYNGQRLDDGFGAAIHLSNLTMNSLLIGGTVLQGLGPGVYTKGHIALGPVHYSSVDGTFSGPGFAPFHDEVFESTWTIASDFRAEIGLRAGPIGFSFGLGLRIQAPPSEGTRVSLHSGAFWTFDLTLGADVGF